MTSSVAPDTVPHGTERPDTAPRQPRALDLAGEWVCRLDREGVGERERWFAAPLVQETIHLQLPGSLQHQGIGDPVTLDTQWVGGIVDRSFFTEDRYAPYREGEEISVPFWLQPRVTYMGAAWYQREIRIPEDWSGRLVELELERVHWESAAWIDDHPLGSRNSLSTAHRYELGRLTPGTHLLTLRIDNRTVIDVGPNAHSVSDHTQGNWNGVIGDLRLTAHDEVRLGRVRVFPDVARRRFTVRTDVVSGLASVEDGELTVTARRDGVLVAREQVRVEIGAGKDFGSRGLRGSGTHLDVELDLGDHAVTWDEFDPQLYDLEVELRVRASGREQRDVVRRRVGLREVAVRGKQIEVNGRPTFLRGTLDCCVFPLTGYPPTEVEPWRRILRIVKAHGLNVVRMHSWCPPEAAFVAADEEGVYLQVESPVWANMGAALGEGRPVDAFIHQETERILREYGDHPSFLMMAHGNEPGGRDREFLAGWVNHWRTMDPRRLYTSAAGWPAIPQNDYDNVPEPRAHRWGEGLESRLNAEPPHTRADYSSFVEATPRPIISHEIGQWCVHPDLREVEKYTGLLQPRNFGIFRDFLEQSGRLDRADAYVHASGRLQVLAYKEDVESALRTEGFGGFHLLGLSDFPGQGTALVGVLDPFWDSKDYCSPEEFRRFCSPTVPLALLDRRVWDPAAEQSFDVRIAHFGPRPLTADVRWRLLGPGGEELASGEVTADEEIPIGNAALLQGVTIPPVPVDGPTQASLVVSIHDEAEGPVENDWTVWLFPEEPTAGSGAETAARVTTTTDLEEALALAAAGARVLCEVPAEDLPEDVALGFTPVFWNTAWTSGQAPHTLGLLHDPEHPAFAGFPSDGVTDWQWWAALRGARPLRLDSLPLEVRPLVEVIDTWFEARRLAVLVEAEVGEGRLLISSLALGGGGEDRLSARQLRRSLLAHLAAPGTAPAPTLDPDQVRSLLGGA